MEIKNIFENKQILDRLTAYIGNYIARHNNKNIITAKYNNITEIDNIINNINNTIEITKDDPALTAKLREYKIKKEEEKDRLLNTLMYDIIPEPETLKASDYKKVVGGCGEPDTLVRVKPDTKNSGPVNLSDILGDILDVEPNEMDPMKDLCDILNDPIDPKKTQTSYQSTSSRSNDDDDDAYYGGCGYSSTKKKKSGGCGWDDEDDNDYSNFYGHC